MNKLVVIKTFTTRLEAQIAKSYLESNNIKAFVTADDEGGMSPFPMTPTTSGVKLFVANKDAKQAIELLKKNENTNH